MTKQAFHVMRADFTRLPQQPGERHVFHAVEMTPIQRLASLNASAAIKEAKSMGFKHPMVGMAEVQKRA